MNQYEIKQEEKRERYEAAALKNRQESESRHNQASQLSDMIPFGQPILIGHHSEGRHRSHLKKIDNNMRKACESSDKAEHYEQKAASVGKGGISSDNPEAVQLLEEKLEKLELRRDKLKEINKAIRADQDPAKIPGMPAECLLAISDTGYSWEKDKKNGRGIVPSWQLSNLGANIRDTKKRIQRLKREASTEPQDDIKGDGFQVQENKEENRIQFFFDERPDGEICSIMRSNGWRWSPTNKAWQRNLNNAGRYSAERVINQIKALKEVEESGDLDGLNSSDIQDIANKLY